VPTGSPFRSIEDALVRDGNHIVIMGNVFYRGVQDSTVIAANAALAAAESWRFFEIAHSDIVGKIAGYKQAFVATRAKVEKSHMKNVKKFNDCRKKLAATPQSDDKPRNFMARAFHSMFRGEKPK
jgi:hypothetical protein